MSRIGKQPINLPSGVDLTVDAGKVIVKGPKGTLTVILPPHATVTLESEPRAATISVEDQTDVHQRAIWGLTRQLVSNAVEGVQKPYQKALEFVGVGYRVSVSGRTVMMEVGFSHDVEFPLPDGVDAVAEKQILTLSSIDKQLIGEIAAQIRRIRPPEPYKGKGIKYVDEVIRRKAGKAAKAS
ncbi:50S ribosomal protein L6 [Candidatus Uhrbacteria bacterium CG22_combo_CG10-13_8_21_14_all_47_17]|uniref:Large ribosomal subunit protein uL6 n=1 Tax=Candidatus Uhrbacteria bacterium CG22_combo_CG10-13_8_21_14_all_47_17 TaxID=1975041 RepID=A0A2H0BTV0_9BACT|nr:MAG: 50S ribosomal protein L6 [Candidatus Uhrbacteria bacterium CG22_combo_CG10-13_8_21_14_all_47_17]